MVVGIFGETKVDEQIFQVFIQKVDMFLQAFDGDFQYS
ncbi:hypothetical protein HSIEG1_1212 [Enterococcus sp. HSIEG1]|nr:hypothetical protein HSIEG1_1212 [Enterococcus sp. HSIEG1]